MRLNLLTQISVHVHNQPINTILLFKVVCIKAKDQIVLANHKLDLVMVRWEVRGFGSEYINNVIIVPKQNSHKV